MVNDKDLCTLPGERGPPGPHPGARPGERIHRRVPGDRAFSHGVWLGSAQKGNVGLSSCGPTTHRKIDINLLLCGLGGSQR